MKIIGYARVSKREQAEDSHALEQQIERLKAAGASEIYQDIQSGYKDRDRPNLKNLIKLVEAQKVNEVIVTRLERLTRKGIEGLKIFDIFIKSEVKLRALDESFNKIAICVYLVLLSC